ncbi:MAG: hypothetical protein JSW50_05015 [Candidatus Latescibacterota bacterium]|nr:MAG: hypothetical protein JSW50_05015 [Candidatus Latescibacterota bacterium]
MSKCIDDVRSHPAALAIILALVVSELLLSGCSHFRASKRLDLGPFAESTITLASDIQLGLTQKKPVYTRDYGHGPAVAEFEMMAKKVRAIIRGTIAYAIEIVTLSESKMSDAERCGELADYLDGLLRPVLTTPVPELNMTVAKLDTIVANVAKQKKFLDGLAAAQPIIDEVARATSEVVEDTQIALDAAVEEVRNEIERDNRDLTTAVKALKQEQIRSILNVRFLKAYRHGDPTAIDSLLAAEPHLKDIVKPGEPVTPADMSAIEQRLIFKLDALRKIREQLQPDLELYWKQHQELEAMADMYELALRQAQVTVIAWDRAHQRLAAGITDPAKINLVGIARKAAGSAVPLP